jgi:hypothetical protein
MADRKGSAMTPPRAAASAGAAGKPTAVVPVERVHGALAPRDDPPDLRTRASAARARGGDRAGRGRALQLALLDAVEALTPTRDGKPGPKALRRYRLPKRRRVAGPAREVPESEPLASAGGAGRPWRPGTARR